MQRSLTRHEAIGLSLVSALALASVVGLVAAMGSVLFALIAGASLAVGFVLGWLFLWRLGDWYLLTPASLAPMLSFLFFAVTGGWYFLFGMSVFMVGVATCGAGLGALGVRLVRQG